jgi:hypothetical protein
MVDLPESVTGGSGFQPSAEDVASVHAWFAEYDSLAKAGAVEKMADMALFPLNVVSDDDSGEGAAAQWDRDAFIASMSHVMGDTGDLKMESVRTPIFLTAQLVLVITEATFTVGGQAQDVRYADMLVKQGGRWLFQTMVQGGWGGNL